MIEFLLLPWVNWASGYVLALALGHLATKSFLTELEWHSSLESRDPTQRLHPALVGLVERLLFTTVVAFEISGATPGMMAWIALKMAAHWNSDEATVPSTLTQRNELLSRRFVALLAGGASMMFATLGGLVALGRIPLGVAGAIIIGTSIGVGIHRRRVTQRITSNASATAT